jgi:tetratricopeptide (TPR) repeat protein
MEVGLGMAKKIKISKKKIKKPDEFIGWSEKAWDWAEENIWIVAGALVGVAVLFILGQGLMFWIKSASESPKAALASAARILRAPVTEDEALIPGLSEGYQSEKEKYEAAAASFKSLMEQYPDTVEGEMAMQYLAGVYEKLGENENAMIFYNKFLKSSVAEKEEALKHSALLGIARLNYKKGYYQQALEQFEQVAESDSAFKVDALVHMARCHFKIGDGDKAKEILLSVRSDYPDSWIAQDSDFLAKFWEEKREKEVKEDTEGEALEFKDSSFEEVSGLPAEE